MTFTIGPDGIAQNVALLVEVQNALPSMPAVAPNASYAVEFAGPALQCEEIPQESVFGPSWTPICASDGSKNNYTKDLEDPNYVGYVSWIPGRDSFWQNRTYPSVGGYTSPWTALSYQDTPSMTPSDSMIGRLHYS